MNSRERVRLALSHKEPDRVPYDLGATIATGIHKQAYDGLRGYLGLPQKEDHAIADMVQQIVVIDGDVAERLKTDARSVVPRPAGAFTLEIKDGGDYTYYHDEWSIGWRMPKRGGLYYDMFDHPLRSATTVEEVDKFPWPNATDPARFEGLRERARRAAEVEGKAVVLGGL